MGRRCSGLAGAWGGVGCQCLGIGADPLRESNAFYWGRGAHMQILIAAMLAGTPAPAPLEYRFEIRRAEGTLYNPWTLSDDNVELRSFVGSGAKAGDFIAPTIRVAPGQRLTIDIANRLEPCTEKQRADH